MNKFSIVLAFVMALSINENLSAKVRMTNAVCESHNKSWVTIEYCRLKAINRDKTVFNVNATVLHPAKKIDLKLQFLKKANGYKPWLINQVIDACAFMQKSNNPVLKIVHTFYKTYSTINHTCPYVGKQVLKDFYVTPDQIPLPLPTGDYGLLMTWFFSGSPQVTVNVYFTFEEDLLKQ